MSGRREPLWLWVLGGLPGGLLLVLLLLPLLALLWATGLGGLFAGLQSPQVGAALRVSLSTSLLALLFVLFLGTPLAFWVGRAQGRSARAAELLLQLPVVLPPSVAGLSMLLAFGRRGLFGGLLAGLGLQVAFTPAAVVLAQIFVASPFYVLAAAAAFRAIDGELLQVSRTLGAGPLRTFFLVALPLSGRGLASGAALGWARALGEFGATLLFAGNLEGVTQTLPLAIYSALERDVHAAQALSLLLLGGALLLLLLVRWSGGGLPRAWTVGDGR